jgi:hypothetical protein
MIYRCPYCLKPIRQGLTLKIDDPSGMAVEMCWHVESLGGHQDCVSLDALHVQLSDDLDNNSTRAARTYEAIRDRVAAQGIRTLMEAIHVRRQPHNRGQSARIRHPSFWGLPTTRRVP